MLEDVVLGVDNGGDVQQDLVRRAVQLKCNFLSISPCIDVFMHIKENEMEGNEQVSL